MDIKHKILGVIKERKIVKTADIAVVLASSRQYASKILNILVNSGDIIKIGSTRGAQYTLPEFIDEVRIRHTKLRLANKDLKEHEIMEQFLNGFPAFKNASENVQSILRYAFSEMLNNAIEHSRSLNIEVELEDIKNIRFIINDFGIGVFRNVMKKRNLKSELEAMQDLLKGKTTTEPKAHSGEGIFFTSKTGDKFILESFGYRMVVDNKIPDVFFESHKPSKKGTRVIFSIASDSDRHLNDIFKQFQSTPGEYAFDRTEIRVRLFTTSTVYVSRSQARRILVGLDKFKSIVLDFDRVPTVGQAFSDEIFRVFKSHHPNIKITSTNMNEAVQFMIKRVDHV